MTTSTSSTPPPHPDKRNAKIAASAIPDRLIELAKKLQKLIDDRMKSGGNRQ